MSSIITFLHDPWTQFFLILILTVSATKAFTMILTYTLRRIALQTETKNDDELVQKIENPLVFIIGFFIIKWALKYVEVKSVDTISNIMDSLILVCIAYVVSRIIELMLNLWGQNFAKRTNSTVDDQLLHLFQSATKLVIFLIAAMYILYIWDIKIWPILGSLGIAGLAIAFALQETLKNIFGGIEIILDKNVAVGDIVEINDTTSGKIVEISVRSTKIRTWDNRLVIVPNSIMANSMITNVTKPDPTRRISVVFSVAYGTNVEFVEKAIMQEINKIKQVIHTPNPRVVFKEMGDSALLFEARYWVNINDYLDAKIEGTTRIYNRLNKEKIEIPFPQQTVWLKKAKK